MNVPNQSFEGDGTLYKMQQEAIRRAYEYNEKHNQKTNSPKDTYKHENKYEIKPDYKPDHYEIKREDFIENKSSPNPFEPDICESCQHQQKKKGGLFGNLFGGGGKNKDNTLFGNFTIEDLIILGIIFLILYNSDEETDWLTIIALGFLFIIGL